MVEIRVETKNLNVMKPINLQLKRLLQTGSFTLAVVIFPLAGLALDVKNVPNPRQINGTWVTDMAGILDTSTEAKLNAEITKLEQKNGAEIAVVTVPETSPSASPKAFTTALFKYWGIGKKGQNNGVLVLISKGDRRVEIETGYGVETILPNAEVSNIIKTQITPKFKQGDFNGGTLAGTKAVIVALEQPSVSNQPIPRSITPKNLEAPSVTTQPAPIAIPSNFDTTTVEAPTQDATGLLTFLGVGGLLSAIGVGIIKHSRTVLEPEGRSRIKGNSRTCYCAICKQRLEPVDDRIIQATLSEPEQVAQKIGSVKFEGWKCPNCSQQLTETGYHRVAYVPHFNQFCECPNCQELTATHLIQTILPPTEYREGKRLITNECQCCDYCRQWEESIPRLPPPPPPTPPSSSSSDYSSSSSSSSSGGSFGGGDSGGGGSGGSW
jgi:uncharacterized protein